MNPLLMIINNVKLLNHIPSVHKANLSMSFSRNHGRSESKKTINSKRSFVQWVSLSKWPCSTTDTAYGHGKVMIGVKSQWKEWHGFENTRSWGTKIKLHVTKSKITGQKGKTANNLTKIKGDLVLSLSPFPKIINDLGEKKNNVRLTFILNTNEDSIKSIISTYLLIIFFEAILYKVVKLCLHFRQWSTLWKKKARHNDFFVDQFHTNYIWTAIASNISMFNIFHLCISCQW